MEKVEKKEGNMARPSKRTREIAKTLDLQKSYSLEEAIDILKGYPAVKFDETVDISLQLGIDSRKSDQNVRGTVPLPNGTGKKIKILVFAKGDKVKEALDAGADYAGHDELLEKVNGGWTDFDAVVSTPDMMREVGKLGKVLGPRGLMPTPKAGSVTADIEKAVRELKAGKIEFNARQSVVNNGIGKKSFNPNQIYDNAMAYINAVLKAKPPTSKGVYLKQCTLSTTMGPGIRIDLTKTNLKLGG